MRKASAEGICRHDGLDLLRYAILFPDFGEEEEQLTSFYRDVALAEEKGVREGLFPLLKERYDADPSRRKRYRSPLWVYRSETVLCFEKEDLLSLKCERLLFRGRELMKRELRAEVWERSTGLLLSPRHFLPSAKERRQIPPGAAFCLTPEGAVAESVFFSPENGKRSSKKLLFPGKNEFFVKRSQKRRKDS